MNLIMSRVRNMCSNHRINVTSLMKQKISNRTVSIENVTIEPLGHIDISALDSSLPSMLIYPYYDLYDVEYQCKFVPIISSHDDQGQNITTKKLILTDDDAIAYGEINFVDENDELKAIMVEGNRLARIWTIWEVRDFGFKLKKYGERITSFVVNFFLELTDKDSEDGDNLRQPLLDATYFQ